MGLAHLWRGFETTSMTMAKRRFCVKPQEMLLNFMIGHINQKTLKIKEI